MKRAGFDAIVITGKSDNPTWLNIDNEAVSFEDAGEWWGKDRVTTYQEISRKLDKKHSIATIGPAGENQVTTANIMFEPEHYADRGGLGAVLGAKKVKAICIGGNQKPVPKGSSNCLRAIRMDSWEYLDNTVHSGYWH